jgi:catechol 2,3-dioxygenase-like lactoylglutathione lyase family enzyme
MTAASSTGGRPGAEIHGISHVSIGVTDLARSRAFYEGVLGLRVVLDREERYSVATLPELAADGGGLDRVVRQRALYLRWSEEPGGPFVVLTQQLERSPFGAPAVVHQTGTNHFGFSVSDLDAVLERARAAGLEVENPTGTWEGGYYGAPGGTARTILLHDPDGAVVQLDEWVERPPA